MIVIDASVAAALFLPEEHTGFARSLLAEGHDLIAPDLLDVEVGNALVKAFRRHILTAAEVRRAIAALTADLVLMHPTAPMLPSAADIACLHRCSIYDALYIELARRTGAIVVTNDNRLAEVAREMAVGVHMPGDGRVTEQ